MPRPGGAGREWVGGRLASSFEIAEPAPHRPDLVLWLLLPDDLLLHVALDDPAAPVRFADTLRAAFEASGPRPRPTRVRVAGDDLADELRRAFGSEIVVRVAPTPELDAALAELEAMERGRQQAHGRRGDFDLARMPAGLWEQLYACAAQLALLRPWLVASEIPIRVDVPRLGVRGACLCLVGSYGEARGFLLFPDVASFERFAERAALHPLRPEQPVDPEVETLLLELVAKSRLSTAQQREAQRRSWPAPARGAHPIVERRGPDGAPLPVRERDLALVTACAAGLAELFASHVEAVAGDEWMPLSVSLGPPGDATIRITIPADAYDDFAPEP